LVLKYFGNNFYQMPNDAERAKILEATVSGLGFMDFCRDYYTRIWITYRTGMPPLLGSQITSDCGWGCMIRTTQMALAHAVVVNRMSRGRPFSYFQSCCVILGLFAQVEVLKLFEDCPSAPLGIHRLLEISCASDVDESSIGRWYAPSEVISLVKKALKLSASPLTCDLSLMLAVDGQVVVGEAERECRHWSKRLLLFVPLRLGTNHVNPVYTDHIRQMLSLTTCLGLLGGKPDHSLYFIGYYGRHVVYLDPHVAHEYVPISTWENLSIPEKKRRKHPLSTYHSRSYSKMAIKEMDPSCVVGFMFKTREEMDESFRILNLNQVVDIDLGPGEGAKRTRDPLFTVQYQETSLTDSLREASEDERQQALEHGFELL
uniref:Cysteine protease n=1 Tax=Heligmosomoides polygyrus TaxID=6339 RepID=A0A8L8JSE1_HELPZ